ncbi:6 TM domain-containing transmembrane protein [Acrasis kona]|uniref:6 TM domain-containing transmembrane protein n=1 Tax=Acrasis kona TaxID=1008807 RepID=A0AAW2ZC18_9EUKA
MLVQTPFVMFFTFLFYKTAPWEWFVTVSKTEEIPVIKDMTVIRRWRTKIHHKGNDILNKVVSKCKAIASKRWQGLLLVLFITVLYFGLLAVIVFVVPLSLVMISGIYQWIIACAGFLIYLVFLSYCYLRLRYEKFLERTLETWRIRSGQKFLLSIVVIALGLISIAGIICVLLLLTYDDYWLSRSLCVFATIGSAAILGSVDLIILSRHIYMKVEELDIIDDKNVELVDESAPKQDGLFEKTDSTGEVVEDNSNSPNNNSVSPNGNEDIDNVYRDGFVQLRNYRLGRASTKSKMLAVMKRFLTQKYWFPFWFSVVPFLLCFTYAGATSFCLVVYGIKFDNDNFTSSQTQWLLGSGIGIVIDIFVKVPLQFFITNVMYSAIMYCLTQALFGHSESADALEHAKVRRLNIVDEEHADFVDKIFESYSLESPDQDHQNDNNDEILIQMRRSSIVSESKRPQDSLMKQMFTNKFINALPPLPASPTTPNGTKLTSYSPHGTENHF